jgi:hypothetical protein
MALSEPRIVCAAIKNLDGLIIPSPRHFDMICHALIKHLGIAGKHSDWEQGFIDQHGTFYSRKAAFRVASTNSQIIRPSPYETNDLYSENLY